MMNKIEVYNAQTNLPDILRRVEAGEDFTITCSGRPVADLIPSKSRQPDIISNAIATILSAKKPIVLHQELVRMKEKGQKLEK